MRGISPISDTAHDDAAIPTGRILAVVAVALMTVVSAVSGLNVALPDLARETGATQNELTWIVDAYTVVFAGLLLFAGALGDRFGRRTLLAIGLVIFGAAAGAGMIVDEPSHLIVARMVMGVGAAAIMPTTLSVITASFPPSERPRAVGVWVGVAGGGAVLGLFGSALLLEWFSWSSFFALNVTLAIIALIGTLAVVPESHESDVALDLPGALLSLMWVSALVYGIIEGSERGWTDELTLTALAVGAVALIGFVLVEMRSKAPLLDPRVFKNRLFSAGTLTICVQFFSAFGFFFIVMQYLQFVLGKSPLMAACAILPMPFLMIPIARMAPHVAARFGFARVAPVGLASMAIGFGILSQLDTELSWVVLIAGVACFGIGMGLAGTPATTAITESLPESKQGVASAVNDTAREVGSAFGIAVLGSLLNAHYRDGLGSATSGLPEPAAEAVRSSIAFTQSPQLDRLGPATDPLVAAANAAFVDGVGAAFWVAAITLAVTAVVVAILGRPNGQLPREVSSHSGHLSQSASD